MQKRIKGLIAIFLSFAMILSYGGCTGNNVSNQSESSQSNSSGEAIENDSTANAPAKTIEYLSVRNADHSAQVVLSQILEEYQEEVNPNFNIEVNSIVDRPTQEQKLKTLVASNNIPDWFEVDANSYCEQLIDKGLIINIAELLEELGVYDKYHASALAYQTINGKIYTLPIENNIEYYWYNKKMFEDAGVAAPETFEELLTVCQKLKDTGVTPIAICGKDGWPLMRYFSFIPFRMTGNEYLHDVVDGKASMADDVGMKGLEHVQQLGAFFQDGFASTDYTSTIDLFMGGKAAIYYTGTWELNTFMNATGEMQDNIDYFHLPIISDEDATRKEDFVTNSGIGIAMCAEKFDDTTKDFVSFMIDRYPEKAIAHGFLPPMETEIPEDSPELLKRIAEDMANVETVAELWDVKLDPVTKELFESELSSVAMGIITPEEFATKVDESIQEKLN